MKKNLLFLAMVLLMGTTVTAQTEKYIEVTVTDSINIIPDRIQYTVVLRTEGENEYPATATDEYGNENPDYALEMKKKEEENKIKLKVMEKRFSDLLAKEKISFTRTAEDEDASSLSVYMMSGMRPQDNNIKAFLLNFDSFAKMNAFTEKIPEDILYSGRLSKVESSQYAKMEEKLLEKLMNKAHSEAEKLASVAHVNLGNLLQYSDNVDNGLVRGIQEVLGSVMSRYERERYLNISKNLTLTKTARVRFAVQ